MGLAVALAPAPLCGCQGAQIGDPGFLPCLPPGTVSPAAAQGAVGGHWELGSLGSLTHTQPEFLSDLISPVLSGTYSLHPPGLPRTRRGLSTPLLGQLWGLALQPRPFLPASSHLVCPPHVTLGG